MNVRCEIFGSVDKAHQERACLPILYGKIASEHCFVLKSCLDPFAMFPKSLAVGYVGHGAVPAHPLNTASAENRALESKGNTCRGEEGTVCQNRWRLAFLEGRVKLVKSSRRPLVSQTWSGTQRHLANCEVIAFVLWVSTHTVFLAPLLELAFWRHRWELVDISDEW